MIRSGHKIRIKMSIRLKVRIGISFTIRTSYWDKATFDQDQDKDLS